MHINVLPFLQPALLHFTVIGYTEQSQAGEQQVLIIIEGRCNNNGTSLQCRTIMQGNSLNHSKHAIDASQYRDALYYRI
jgi:hypothetical protein